MTNYWCYFFIFLTFAKGGNTLWLHSHHELAMFIKENLGISKIITPVFGQIMYGDTRYTVYVYISRWKQCKHHYMLLFFFVFCTIMYKSKISYFMNITLNYPAYPSRFVSRDFVELKLTCTCTFEVLHFHFSPIIP